LKIEIEIEELNLIQTLNAKTTLFHLNETTCFV